MRILRWLYLSQKRPRNLARYPGKRRLFFFYSGMVQTSKRKLSIGLYKRLVPMKLKIYQIVAKTRAIGREFFNGEKWQPYLPTFLAMSQLKSHDLENEWALSLWLTLVVLHRFGGPQTSFSISFCIMVN